MGYPPVKIFNSTPYSANGTVGYLSWLCSDDNYHVDSFHEWTGPGRGTCLVTKISALLKTPEGDVWAQPYTSSGTSFSQFAIIQVGAKSFEVTRRTTGQEDAPPADYVEPTEKQK